MIAQAVKCITPNSRATDSVERFHARNFIFIRSEDRLPSVDAQNLMNFNVSIVRIGNNREAYNEFYTCK